jgi:hypothetical protein
MVLACHSERSKESTWTYVARVGPEPLAGFFAALRVTGGLKNSVLILAIALIHHETGFQ